MLLIKINLIRQRVKVHKFRRTLCLYTVYKQYISLVVPVVNARVIRFIYSTTSTYCM